MTELVITEIPRAFHANVLIFESFLGLQKCQEHFPLKGVLRI